MPWRRLGPGVCARTSDPRFFLAALSMGALSGIMNDLCCGASATCSRRMRLVRCAMAAATPLRALPEEREGLS